MNATTTYLDSLDWVERYAWFGYFVSLAAPLVIGLASFSKFPTSFFKIISGLTDNTTTVSHRFIHSIFSSPLSTYSILRLLLSHATPYHNYSCAYYPRVFLVLFLPFSYLLSHIHSPQPFPDLLDDNGGLTALGQFYTGAATIHTSKAPTPDSGYTTVHGEDNPTQARVSEFPAPTSGASAQHGFVFGSKSRVGVIGGTFVIALSTMMSGWLVRSGLGW